MKLDLNKPWVMKLVRNHSTKNGCSFIRGVILHYLWKGTLVGVLGVLGIWAAISLLAGPIMYFFGDNFFLDGKMHLDYFGDSAIAKFLAASFFVGGIAWIFVGIVGTAFGLAYGFVTGLKKTVQSGVIGTALDKIIPSFSIPVPLKEAVLAWHDKFCPKIELILPDKAQGYVKGARILRRTWDYDAETNVFVEGGLITDDRVAGRTLCLRILWDENRDAVDAMIKDSYPDDTPEELEARRQRLYDCYTSEERFWLDVADEDWDDFKLAPVEETSSPE